MTRQCWLIDHLFSMTPGIAHTIVNPGFFADDYLVPIGLAAHLGMFPWMYGDSRNAPPSNEDIARVAATVLMDPARHAGKSYRPTGPELLGAKEMAQAIGRAVGRSVRVMPTPTWLFMKSARIAGLPMDAMSNIRYYIEDHKQGAFEKGAPTTDVFDVTGRPAEDFETIARRYGARPRNQRTLSDWIREFGQFMTAPFTRVSTRIATNANCDDHFRRRQGCRPNPRSGGVSTTYPISSSPRCQAVRVNGPSLTGPHNQGSFLESRYDRSHRKGSRAL